VFRNAAPDESALLLIHRRNEVFNEVSPVHWAIKSVTIEPAGEGQEWNVEAKVAAKGRPLAVRAAAPELARAVERVFEKLCLRATVARAWAQAPRARPNTTVRDPFFLPKLC